MDGLDISEAVAAFMVEGRELVESLETGLLSIEQGHDRGDRELVNAMFRAAHTIKGSAGIVGLDGLSRFTHHVESLLDRVREGQARLEDDQVTLLLQCCDHMRALLEAAEADDPSGARLEEAGLAVLARLGAGIEVAGTRADVVAPDAGSGSGFRLWAVFGDGCLRDGLDPLAAMAYLAQRAPDLEVVLHAGRVPPLAQLDPLHCRLALAARSSTGDPSAAREALEFFADDSVVAVVPRAVQTAEATLALAPLRGVLGDEPPEVWLEAGLLSSAEWHGVAMPAAAKAPASGLGTLVNVHAAGEGANRPGAAAAPKRIVKVPADRLDALIQQVGELVVTGAGVHELARRVREPRLMEAVDQLKLLIDDMQSGTLALRMVAIGETFSRFQRVVRDVAHELGKQVHFETAGGDTELDKALVDRIADPLMHLVRNAMDHGIETPAEREAQGKPPEGTLRLRAFHDSGSVVIEVSDDGRGLDRRRILAKAVERGLVGADETLADHEIDRLIFEPGFSTAAAVTSLSGRGVGMDVVKQAVEALRGSIELRSDPGQGTLMQIRLPLTLAIIDGFMVGVGPERFILPLDMVVECVELPAEAVDPRAPRYVSLRGELLPYVALRETFATGGQVPRRPSIVVVRAHGRTAGVLVDTLHGEIQTVIKPMACIFRHLRAVSGTSVLGTGDIALILDLPQLIQTCVDRATRVAGAATND
ncbi:MAG: chemotaxis protein CheA [Burkholderiaceae bacterium]|nr:chemotaxis protein CheA [Rhodoferax sp.]MCP5285192.1 chemotaxis protein CheA [Burkholderiaceae bacterium]